MAASDRVARDECRELSPLAEELCGAELPTGDAVTFEGYAMKAGGKGHRRKWQRRYLVVTGAVLRYYDSQGTWKDRGAPRGRFEVVAAGPERTARGVVSQQGFYADASGGRRYHFTVQSLEDRARWLSHLLRGAGRRFSADALAAAMDGRGRPARRHTAPAPERSAAPVSMPAPRRAEAGGSDARPKAQGRTSSLWRKMRSVGSLFRPRAGAPHRHSEPAAPAARGLGEDEDEDEDKDEDKGMCGDALVDGLGVEGALPAVASVQHRLFTAFGLLQARGGSDAGATLNGLKLLAALSTEDAPCLAIVAGGGISVVMAAMARFPGDTAVQEKALKVVANLACAGEDVAETLIASGVLVPVFAALGRHQKSAGVQAKGCWALKNLACTRGNIQDIVDDLGVAALLGALRAHAGAPSVQEQGLTALSNLLGAADHVGPLGDMGIGRVLSAAKWRHPDNAVIQNAVAGLEYIVDA